METKLQDGLYQGVLAMLGGVFFLSFAFWLMVVCRVDMPLVLAALGTCTIGIMILVMGWLSAVDTFPFLLAALSIICGALFPVFSLLLQRHGFGAEASPGVSASWPLILLIPLLGMTLRDFWLGAVPMRKTARPRVMPAASTGWSVSI